MRLVLFDEVVFVDFNLFVLVFSTGIDDDLGE